MKTILTLFVLFFSSSLVAENISDFEIEGISIGHSLLDHIGKEEIKKFSMPHYYPGSDKEYLVIEFYKGDLDLLKNYDVMQITYHNNDNDSKIYGLTGANFYEDILECKKEVNKIVNEIEYLFVDYKKNKSEIIHPRDASGKSTVSGYEFNSPNFDFIQVACFDWSDEMGYTDNLRIEISESKFNFWRDNYYYK